jgi:hypothetical protein
MTEHENAAGRPSRGHAARVAGIRAGRARTGRLLRAAALCALLGLLLHLGIMASPAHAGAAATVTGHHPLDRHATGGGDVSGSHHPSPGDRPSVPAPLAAGALVPEGAGALALADHPNPGAMPGDCAISPAPARGTPSFAPPPLGNECLVLAHVEVRPLAAAPRTRWPAARPPPGGVRAFLQVFLL